MIHHLLHWLAVHTGTINEAGPYYGFLSGFGSDLTELAAAIALVWAILRRHNCAVHRCWRIGRHKVPGTDHLCCRKHAPGGAPTHDDVIADHLAATTPGPTTPAGQAAVLAELRGLRTDVTGLAQTVRSLMLADRTGTRGRRPV